jgi:hypothetical protein
MKALATIADPMFDPNKNRHQRTHGTGDIVTTYAELVPCFLEFSQDTQVQELFEQLQESYFIVRYGNGVVGYGREDWERFCSTANRLFDALQKDTGLYFPVGLRIEP